MLDPVGEQPSVGQPGEGVVPGPGPEFVLQGLALAHVPGIEHDAPDVRLVDEVVEGALGVAPRAVPTPQAAFHHRAAAGGLEALSQESEDLGCVLRVDPLDQ